MVGGSLVYHSVLNKNKFVTKLLYISVLVAVSTLSLVFFQNRPKTLYALSVPLYYEESLKYLNDNSASCVMVLPSSGGLSPDMGPELNYYRGIDILQSVWDIPILYPDLGGISHDMPQKKILQEIYLGIGNLENICDKTRELGITHIVWRDDTKFYKDQNLERDVKAILERSSYIESYEKFGEINIYALKNECREGLVVGNKNYMEARSLEIHNKTSHSITFVKPEGVSRIKLHKNFDTNWRLIKIGGNVAGNQFLTELSGIFKPGQSPNSGSYYNEWSVDSDGGFYTIYYYSQKFVYIGALISILYLLFICIVSRKQDVKKHPSI